MDKSDLLSLSKLRVKEAKALLNVGHYNGAYYLAGYAIECAVKACIAGKIKNNVVPDKNFGEKFYQHNLEKLLRAAELWPKFESEIKTTPSLNVNWAIVKDWNESSRYKNLISKAQASDLVNAITARKYGILGWIKKCI